MRVINKQGKLIDMLWRTARCEISGKMPFCMKKCPICNFDDDGKYCVPELCDHYTEEEEQ